MPRKIGTENWRKKRRQEHLEMKEYDIPFTHTELSQIYRYREPMTDDEKTQTIPPTLGII